MNTFEEDIDQIDSDIYVDLYGFEYKYSEDSELIEELKLQKKLEEDRFEEWTHYIQSTCISEDEIFRYIKRHSGEESFKEILSHGIHPKFRKEIWTIFLDSFNLDFKKGYYWSLLKNQEENYNGEDNSSPHSSAPLTTALEISRASSYNDLSTLNSPTNLSVISSSTDSLKDDDSLYNKSNSITFIRYKHEILSDLERTFPTHPKSLDPDFKEKLKRILFVFSETNPNVGYCQSLNYITFFLLMIIENEEQVFWCLSYITDQLLVEYYNKTMLGSQVDQSVLLDLLEEIFPELNSHLNSIGAVIPVLSMEWFLCLFTVSLPSQATLIIWDNFFVRGSRVLLEIALGLIEMNMNQLMNAKNHIQVTEILSNKPFNPELFKTIQNSYKRIGVVLSKKRIQDLKLKHWEITKKQVKEKEEQKDLRHLLKITKFDIQKLKELKEEFDFLSVDGTGIGFLQFQQLILRFLPDWNNCENSLLFKMFKRIDKDEDNLLDFKELVEALSVLSHGNIDQKLKFIFKLFAIEYKDFITRNELRNLIDHVHFIYFEPYLKDYPDEIKGEYLKKKEDFLISVKEKSSFQDLKQIAYENPLIIESFRISTSSPTLTSSNGAGGSGGGAVNISGYSSTGTSTHSALKSSNSSSNLADQGNSNTEKNSSNKRRSDSFHLLNLEGQTHLAIKKEQQKKQEQLQQQQMLQQKQKEKEKLEKHRLKLKLEQEKHQREKEEKDQPQLQDKNLKSPTKNIDKNNNNNSSNNNNSNTTPQSSPLKKSNSDDYSYGSSILKKLEPIKKIIDNSNSVTNVFKKSGEVYEKKDQKKDLTQPPQQIKEKEADKPSTSEQSDQDQPPPPLGDSCLIITAHSVTTKRNNVLINISVDGVDGYGECGLPPKKPLCYLADFNNIENYYNQWIKEVDEKQKSLKQDQDFFYDSFKKLPKEYFEKLRDKNTTYSVVDQAYQFLFECLDECSENTKDYSYASRCAIEMALLDGWGKTLKLPIYKMANLVASEPKPFYYTVSMCPTMEEILDSTDFGSKYTSFLKIKLDQDVEKGMNIINHVKDYLKKHNKPIAKISVDANSSWTPQVARLYLEKLEPMADIISMVEQPFPIETLKSTSGAAPLESELNEWVSIKKEYQDKGFLIFADESICTEKDLDSLVQLVHGVNIKLEKTGGIRYAISTLLKAKEMGLKTWIGSMVASSLDVSAAAHLLCSLSDFGGDLDGGLLIDDETQLFKNDAFDLVDNGLIKINPNHYGVGVTKK
ncbi:hypothetical protein DICPUDRAFT_154788 [Dictyostelium purpureum]|uniref:Rab-GAP TBC domain-containing protein n=1 Tax=Dictyostelium purpureum TaxID=5786 RepID=F0ZS95_DICPU|nr:uncharacterized protein DICPUDRAFT_154788 [Dictyostelium purpureum]EGC33168.1 hypothetical protein DICPUDRAFT_154788 [Dictyostelium purpureum]|eukprot:XP_003290288.1 hypothetical protein DICPUDRAFT_154788 [Dictyostelium purpureum]